MQHQQVILTASYALPQAALEQAYHCGIGPDWAGEIWYIFQGRGGGLFLFMLVFGLVLFFVVRFCKKLRVGKTVDRVYIDPSLRIRTCIPLARFSYILKYAVGVRFPEWHLHVLWSLWAQPIKKKWLMQFYLHATTPTAGQSIGTCRYLDTHKEGWEITESEPQKLLTAKAVGRQSLSIGEGLLTGPLSSCSWWPRHSYVYPSYFNQIYNWLQVV